MARNNKLSLGLVLALSLVSCASPVSKPTDEHEVDTRVREPARQDSAGVQVFPLQNPAVKELLAEAAESEAAGDFDQAAILLERALRIHPQDPEILQHMAEIQLRKKDYQQALNFAERSYDVGPRVGEICSRNWRTISVARGHFNDGEGSDEAEQKATQCMNTKPRSL